MKRNRILVGLALLLLLVVTFAVVRARSGPTSDEQRTLASFRKIDDFPLYVMHYYGEYGFMESLQGRSGVQSPGCPTGSYPAARWACTCFAALGSAGDRIFGRNFDWTTRAALLLFTDPPDRYASVSMVDITYLGFDAREPNAKQCLLQAPFLPFDGMNEEGLAVGMMAVDAEAPKDPGKTTVGSLEAIRLLLDYAGTVREAVALLQEYNIDFGNGPPLHYLIADAIGEAVVVEYVHGEMRVTPNSQPWQVATNFVLSEVRWQRAQSPCWRYNTTWQILELGAGNLSAASAMNLLERVSQTGSSGTRWSVVYGLTSGDVHLVMGRHYQQVYEFDLPMSR